MPSEFNVRRPGPTSLVSSPAQTVAKNRANVASPKARSEMAATLGKRTARGGLPGRVDLRSKSPRGHPTEGDMPVEHETADEALALLQEESARNFRRNFQQGADAATKQWAEALRQQLKGAGDSIVKAASGQ